MDKINLTIGQILSLEGEYDNHPYINYQELESLLMLSEYYCGEFENKYVTVKGLVYDDANDCRSRALELVSYKGVPFFIFQYIGRGYYRNEHIIDKKVFKEFIKDKFLYEIENEVEINQLDKSDIITVDSYGQGFVLENDKLTCIKAI